MKQIALSRALAYFLEELWYTEAALSADADAAALAAPFDDAIRDWEAIALRERTARRGMVRSDAVVAVSNGQIDTETGRFAGILLVEAGNDRKSTFFKRFFTEAPSAFVARNLRDQCEQTRDRIVPEVQKLPAESPLRPYADRLLALAKRALSALTQRTKARGDNATVASDVAEWKEGINRLRTATYAELLKIAVEKRYPRDWAETFFRRDEASSSSEGEADPTPPDPTPVTPR